VWCDQLCSQETRLERTKAVLEMNPSHRYPKRHRMTWKGMVRLAWFSDGVRVQQ
jgi:hypothetical protein